jgi:peptidoglycan/LPS O-acetylase OafA/YrhL
MSSDKVVTRLRLRPINPGLSSALDASRWIAALMVVVHHVRHIALVDFSDVQDKALVAKIFYFLTGFGTEAVVVFFVISGLLVGGLTLGRWEKVGPQAGDYFVRRAARIYTVLVPALIAGFVLDKWGAAMFNGAALYSNSAQYHTISLNYVIRDNLALGVLLGNLAMLENIRVPIIGSNGPLWSLAYEWWYYGLFAAALGAGWYRGPRRWVSILALLLMLVLLPFKLLLWMLVWLLGVGVFVYCRSGRPKPHPWLGMAILVAGLAISRLSHNAENVASREPLYIEFGRDLGLGLCYAIALVSFDRLQGELQLQKWHARLAGFSYSLYLTHAPMMLFAISILYAAFGLRFRYQPGAAGYVYFVVVVALLVGYAALFASLTERHTGAIDGAIRTRLLQLRSGLLAAQRSG